LLLPLLWAQVLGLLVCAALLLAGIACFKQAHMSTYDIFVLGAG
jgi:hypothetical protein